MTQHQNAESKKINNEVLKRISLATILLLGLLGAGCNSERNDTSTKDSSLTDTTVTDTSVVDSLKTVDSPGVGNTHGPQT